MIVLFIIALIGFAIACPGITFFLLWFFTRPLVIGAIVVFVIISVIAICAAENKEETKNTSLNKPPNKLYIEKEDWYIRPGAGCPCQPRDRLSKPEPAVRQPGDLSGSHVQQRPL